MPIYIPFWLNLYAILQQRKSKIGIYLHSILVKSIHEYDLCKEMFRQIYIPFWLNLYPYNHRTLISAAKTPPFCRPRYYTYLVYQINLINTDPISILTK